MTLEELATRKGQQPTISAVNPMTAYKDAYREAFNFHARHITAVKEKDVDWDAIAADSHQLAHRFPDNEFFYNLIADVFYELDRVYKLSHTNNTA